MIDCPAALAIDQKFNSDLSAVDIRKKPTKRSERVSVPKNVIFIIFFCLFGALQSKGFM